MNSPLAPWRKRMPQELPKILGVARGSFSPNKLNYMSFIQVGSILVAPGGDFNTGPYPGPQNSPWGVPS